MKDLCYASIGDGTRLPVVDITNPAFDERFSPAELDAIAERTRRGLERSRKLPRFALRLLARRSVIMRGMIGAHGGYVGGMTTYLFKVGPRLLPAGYGNRLDRQMLSALGPVACRLRLRETALQLADALSCRLQEPSAPVGIIDIGGGVGADAINALLLLQVRDASLIAGRPLRILILDIDSEAAAFGARALSALCQPEGPLAGVDASLEHASYDWTDALALKRHLCQFPRGSATVASSEGGLFEYADDTAVRENLAILREVTPHDFAIVGSLVRDDDSLRWMTRGAGSPGLRPRGLGAFGALADGAGWEVRSAATNPMYHVVTLRKAG